MGVTQPVFGSPQVKEENYMVNQCFAKGATSSVDKIGIMVYQGTGSLQYVDGYVHGTQQWEGFPIKVDVPSQAILLGAGGQASAGTIEKLAQIAHDRDLGGIMVWYASVIDSATGKVGNQYSGGAMDASIQSAATQAAWKNALGIMQGKSQLMCLSSRSLLGLAWASTQPSAPTFRLLRDATDSTCDVRVMCLL